MFCLHQNLVETPGPHDGPLEVRTQTQGNPKSSITFLQNLGVTALVSRTQNLTPCGDMIFKEAAGCNELIGALPNAVLLIRR